MRDHPPRAEIQSDRDEKPDRDKNRMHVKIKASLEFSVSDSALEDALAEFDELTVTGLLREMVDKAIACDEIHVKIEEGPNTLEEYDQLNQ